MQTVRSSTLAHVITVVLHGLCTESHQWWAVCARERACARTYSTYIDVSAHSHWRCMSCVNSKQNLTCNAIASTCLLSWPPLSAVPRPYACSAPATATPPQSPQLLSDMPPPLPPPLAHHHVDVPALAGAAATRTATPPHGRLRTAATTAMPSLRHQLQHHTATTTLPRRYSTRPPTPLPPPSRPQQPSRPPLSPHPPPIVNALLTITTARRAPTPPESHVAAIISVTAKFRSRLHTPPRWSGIWATPGSRTRRRSVNFRVNWPLSCCGIGQ